VRCNGRDYTTGGDILQAAVTNDGLGKPDDVRLRGPIVPVVKCDSDRAQAFILVAIGFRAPARGELYIGKDGLVHRRKEIGTSRRTRKVPIVREAWL